MKKEVYSLEFIKYPLCDKSRHIRTEMVKEVIYNKGFTLLDFQNAMAFGTPFVKYVLPFYLQTNNQKYIFK